MGITRGIIPTAEEARELSGTYEFNRVIEALEKAIMHGYNNCRVYNISEVMINHLKNKGYTVERVDRGTPQDFLIGWSA